MYDSLDKTLVILLSIVFAIIDGFLTIYQIKSFFISALFRQSVHRVGGAHLHVIVPGQHSSFPSNDAAVASRWQR